MRSLTDVFGPYIVGGIVILTMSAVLLNGQAETDDASRNERAQTIVAELGMQLERDLNSIGYGVPGPIKITRLSFTTLAFLADIDDNGIVDTIEYCMTRTSEGSRLVRRQTTPGQLPIIRSMHGAVVRFIGNDSTGNPVGNLALIRAVTMQIATIDQATDIRNEVGRTRGTHREGEVNAFWSKTICPPGLQSRTTL